MAVWFVNEAAAWFRALAQACSALLLVVSIWWYLSTFASDSWLHTEVINGPLFLTGWILGAATVVHIWQVYGMPSRQWFWDNGFISQFRGFPSWFPYVWLLLFISIGLHFAILVSDRTVGSPTFVDGKYVLEQRGRLHELLTDEDITKAQYFAAKRPEIRLEASFAFTFAFFSSVCWWLGRGSDSPVKDLIEIE